MYDVCFEMSDELEEFRPLFSEALGVPVDDL